LTKNKQKGEKSIHGVETVIGQHLDGIAKCKWSSGYRKKIFLQGIDLCN